LYDAILHHGTLMVNVNMRTLGQVLRISNPKETLINLSEALPNKISINEIKNALKSGFEKAFGINLIGGSLSREEYYLARKLLKIKYSQKLY
ncbi:MAG: hypothetical protein QXU46_07100, partial [Candidatus Bathyarchaeia archaeon]